MFVSFRVRLSSILLREVLLAAFLFDGLVLPSVP